MKAQAGSRSTPTLFFNLGARRGWVINATAHSDAALREGDPVQEVGWPPGPVWTVAECRIRYQGSPALIDSLYRIR